VVFLIIFLGIEILTKLNKKKLENISGVYITKTKFSNTFSISFLSKNGEISPGKFFLKKNIACNMKGYLTFFYSHIFESRQIWLNIFMDNNHHFEQHNKIEKKKTIELKRTFFLWGKFFCQFSLRKKLGNFWKHMFFSCK
jgi:hypothetical protein